MIWLAIVAVVQARTSPQKLVFYFIHLIHATPRSLGSVLRPIRFAIAVSMTPAYTNFVGRVRDRLPFRATRPKLNRTLAIVFVSLVLNIIGTCSLIFLGISFAGLVTGVRPFPAGWSFGK